MYIHDTGCTHNFAKKIFKAMNSEPVYELLRTVCKNLEASKKAYTDYLVNGKTFRFAQELKKYNTRIMELLSAKQGLLSSSLQQDAATLLAHYTSWIEKWNTLAAEMNPQPDDVFVFVNDITFPKLAAQNIEMVHKNLTPISRATEKDIPALIALINSAYRGDTSKKGWTTEADMIEGNIRTNETDVLEFMQQPDTVFLKYSNDKNEIEGCVFLQKREGKLYLGMLSVSPTVQAKGTGKKIMTAAEDYARQMECPAIFMRVISIRYELIAWYERQGYQKTGLTEPFPTDNTFGTPKQPLEFLILEKSL